MYDLQKCVDVDGCEIFTYYDLTGLCLLYSECTVADCDAGQDCITGVPDGQVVIRFPTFELIIMQKSFLIVLRGRRAGPMRGQQVRQEKKVPKRFSVPPPFRKELAKFHGISL